MIGVIATLDVQEGKAAEFEAVFRDLVTAVRANEPGCNFYGLHKRSPTQYVVLERYASAAALEEHGKTAHFQAALPRLGALLAGPPVIERLDGVI